MSGKLISKPGITSASTLSIPTTWDKTWFRNFIQNQLKGADVRNAIGSNGIVVNGTIASPYATISIGGSGPVTLPSPVTIPATAGQVSLTVDGASGENAILVVSGNSSTAAVGDLDVFRAGSTANQVAQGPNLILQDTAATTVTCLQQSGGQTELWQFNSGVWNQVLYVTTSDAVVCNQLMQFKGYPTSPGLTGSGVEVGFSSGNGYVQSYNRTASAYTPLILTGSTIALNPSNATTGFTISGSGTYATLLNSSAAYSSSYGGVAGIQINNLSSTMQSVLDFGKNGVLSGRLRNDYAGNLTYVATGSGVHTFYCGGDTGTGTAQLTIVSGGITFNAVATTTTAPAAGGAGALPATPKGYFTLTIGTYSAKVPYY